MSPARKDLGAEDYGSESSRRSGAWASFNPGAPLVLGGGGFDAAADQYRKLSQLVEKAIPAGVKRGYSLAVSAPEAGAGKTLTSLNLGLAISRGGERRVLVIECDLWKPTFQQMLTTSSSPMTLGSLLRDEIRPSLERSVVSLWSLGIDLLIGGHVPDNGDLVSSQRMSDLVSEARGIYDIVILDTPPFEIASGRALTALADGVLIVVKPGQTKRKGLEEILTSVGIEKTLGFVLNGVKKPPANYPTYSHYSGEYPGSAASQNAKNPFFKFRKD